MAHEFELKEGMFCVVPCETTDVNVLRLKRLVQGHEMGYYEPNHPRQLEQETKHKMLGANFKQQKTETSDNGVNKASCSKTLEQPSVLKKKLASDNLILEQDQKRKTSSVAVEQIRKDKMNSTDNTKDRNDKKQPPSNTYSPHVSARSEKVTSTVSSNSPKHRQKGPFPVSRNPLRHHSSPVSRKTAIYLPPVTPQVTRISFAQRLTETSSTSRNHKNHPQPDSLVRQMATPPSATPAINGNLSMNRLLGTPSNSQTHSTHSSGAASLVDRKTPHKPSVTLSIPERCPIPNQAGTVPVKNSNTVNVSSGTSLVSRKPSNHHPSVKSSGGSVKSMTVSKSNLVGHHLKGNSSIQNPPKNSLSDASPVIRKAPVNHK